MAFQRDAFQEEAFQTGLPPNFSGFQSDAFQGDAFQIGAPGQDVPPPPAVVVQTGDWQIPGFIHDVSKRINEEREDKESRRARIQELYEDATGKRRMPPPVEVQTEIRKLEKKLTKAPDDTAIRGQLSALEELLREYQALFEIEASLKLLEKQREEMDIAYIVTMIL